MSVNERLGYAWCVVTSGLLQGGQHGGSAALSVRQQLFQPQAIYLYSWPEWRVKPDHMYVYQACQIICWRVRPRGSLQQQSCTAMPTKSQQMVSRILRLEPESVVITTHSIYQANYIKGID
jgi:hypothetical protein